MADSAYRYQDRTLACASCAAPVSVPTQGGEVTCRDCDTEASFGPRDESPIGGDRDTGGGDRLAALRKQRDKPPPPPPTLPWALMTWSGDSDEERGARALTAWQEARVAIAGGDKDAKWERHLQFLSLALANHFAAHDEPTRLRALLETAAEVTRSDQNRQILRCSLARQAARAGDLDAAEAWLATCDPEPDDLQMDTVWRHSRAYLSTCAGDWDGALAALGERGDQIPTASAYDCVCAVFRANALERSGRTDDASRELRRALRRTGSSPRILPEIAKSVSELELCPESLPPIYEAGMRFWRIRYWTFMVLWIGGINYLLADWMARDQRWWSVGIDSPLPAIAVGLLGYFFVVRWKP